MNEPVIPEQEYEDDANAESERPTIEVPEPEDQDDGSAESQAIAHV
jgi:hypothetical protein